MKGIRQWIHLVLLFAMPLLVEAQATWTEQEVIQKALVTYPTIRAAGLEVEKMKALQKTAFNPDQPQFTIETPADVGIGFEVEQSIAFPTVYTRRGAWLNSKTDLADESAKLTRNELVREVRTAYLSAQIAQQRLAYLDSQDSLWQVIAHNSQRLFDAGDIGRAELVLAQHRAGTNTLARKQAAVELDNLLAALSSYVNEPVGRVADLIGVALQPATSQGYYFEPYYTQQAIVNENETRMLRAQRGPDIILGYLRVPDFDTEYRYRYKLGLTVPLFQSQYTGEIRAARYEQMQLAAEREEKTKEASLAALQWENVIEQTAASLDWYEQTGLRQRAELTDINMRLYEAGEIDYALALRNISDAGQWQDHFFEVLEMHHKAIIELEYLKGTGDE